MDKEKATVTMSLKDYEEMDRDLKWYKDRLKNLNRKLKEATIVENEEIKGIDFQSIKDELEDIIYGH